MADNEIIVLRTKMVDETSCTLPSGQIWSKMSFNTHAYLKGRGHILMTIFDKSGKTRQSDFLFWTIWF
jgi:hypothetical protein